MHVLVYYYFSIIFSIDDVCCCVCRRHCVVVGQHSGIQIVWYVRSAQMYDFVKDQPQPLLLIVIEDLRPSSGIAVAIDHSKVRPRNDIAISIHHSVVFVVGRVGFLPLTG